MVQFHLPQSFKHQTKMKKQPATKKKVSLGNTDPVRAYLARQSPEVRAGLTQLCKSIRAIAPDAEPSTSYGIPAFRINGRPLVWFAAFKQHCSFFPGAGAIRIHSAALTKYKTSKGTIQFPHGNPPPSGLVAKLVKARLAEMQPVRKPVGKKK